MTNKTPDENGVRLNTRLLITTVVLAAVAAIAATGLLVNIFEHRLEAKNPFYKVVQVSDNTDDPATWGKNFPMQYSLYERTKLQEATLYGGDEPQGRNPTPDDPRPTVARSNLDKDPRLKTMWAGYAFSADYRERRGHAFMLDDQVYTGRQKFAKQPGTCLNCHASLYVAYKKEGNGDITKGFEKINKMPYAEARKLVQHPVGCIDCHEPNTMQLRISRPAFIEGIRALKASQGVADFDVNTQATLPEMRSYVCAQCHVEYYFKPPDKRLTFPWAKGVKIEQITQFYDDEKFKDWVHGETGAPLLKAQHPEFEMWSTGIHARSNVSCADCHMPYRRSGGLKISDHHVRSPLLNINRSCQTCHHWDEKEIKARVEDIQKSFFNEKSVAMDALMDLIRDISAAKANGATDADLEKARDYQRKASFYLDFAMSENSMGFHSPAESQRVLTESINFCRLGQLSLRTNTPLLKRASADTPAVKPVSASAKP
ncbi:MAG: ammonia-forming cytochrome c nitrite reductase subunit c552 [Terriglobales bacterium]